MGIIKNLTGRVRIVYRPSSPLLKCVVLAAIVLSTAAILVLRGSILEVRRQEEALRQEAIALQQEIQRLETNIAELGTVGSVKRIAGEKLDLVDPNMIFFNIGK